MIDINEYPQYEEFKDQIPILFFNEEIKFKTYLSERDIITEIEKFV